MRLAEAQACVARCVCRRFGRCLSVPTNVRAHTQRETPFTTLHVNASNVLTVRIHGRRVTESTLFSATFYAIGNRSPCAMLAPPVPPLCASTRIFYPSFGRPYARSAISLLRCWCSAWPVVSCRTCLSLNLPLARACRSLIADVSSSVPFMMMRDWQSPNSFQRSYSNVFYSPRPRHF